MKIKELEATKQISREMVACYWPEQLELFDAYWPYYEQQPDTQRRIGRQGGAESFIQSPYVAGIVTTIVGHLIIHHAPGVVAAVKRKAIGLKEQLQQYYKSNPDRFGQLREACTRLIGDHSLFEEVMARLESYLQVSGEREDERSEHPTDDRRDS